jgi:hypothetical protein
MRCLWITREATFPETAGDVLYSGGLIRALADAGVELTVLCHARADASGAPAPPGIRWRIVGGATHGAARSLLARLPNVAARYDIPELRARLREELRVDWDVVVFDHLGSGWALDLVADDAGGGRRPQLVYVAHNHEASTRRSMAEHGTDPVRVRLLALDARKAAALERRLVAAADLVTVITEDDSVRFAVDSPATRLLTLTPGYSDRIVEMRHIDEHVPRRAVVLGSFDWMAKRMNLEQLLEVADARFAAAGAELLVVGRGPADWIATMEARTTATRFTGPVDDVTDHLDDVRIGLVAEPSGGGFKLKVLHYVFNRVPIAALEGSVAGVPLAPGHGLIGAPDLPGLVDAALAALDDPAMLDDLQQTAFAACAGRFSWAARGETLVETLAAP